MPPIDMGKYASILSHLLICAVIVYITYRVWFNRKANFIIDVENGRAVYRGNIALAEQQVLNQFFTEDLEIVGSIRIGGSWQGDRLELWFRGPIEAHTQQRIRNFLQLNLRR